MPGRTHAAVGLALALALAAAGCGASSQGAGGDGGSGGPYRVSVPAAIFPPKQRLAEETAMYIAVRNDDTRTIPNLAVTIDSFNYRTPQPNVSNPLRPIWIVDEAPYGGQTAYVSTWALGRLPPGQTAIFRWKVTPVKAGIYHVGYRVAADLDGHPVAQLAAGEPAAGAFNVYIPTAPAVAKLAHGGHRVLVTPQSAPQPVPQVKPNTSPPIGPNEPQSTTPAY